jgi:hypothetical protein
MFLRVNTLKYILTLIHTSFFIYAHVTDIYPASVNINWYNTFSNLWITGKPEKKLELLSKKTLPLLLCVQPSTDTYCLILA